MPGPGRAANRRASRTSRSPGCERNGPRPSTKRTAEAITATARTPMVRKSGIASTLCATESSTSATSSSEASVSPLTRAAATRAASGRCLRDPSTAQGYIGPVSGSLHGQLGRFLVVGTCTVAVDFVVYRGLLAVSAPVNPAKATSFVVATVLAYVLNRLWTFRAPGGPRRAAAFVVLYATALIVNVGVNGAALRILGDVR